MSWSSFSGLASQALIAAQKKIDKALDIDEGGSGKQKSSTKAGKTAPVSSSTEDASGKEESNSWNSWSSWMSPKQTEDKDKKPDTAPKDTESSWGFSWGSRRESTPVTLTSSSSSSKRTLPVTKKSSSSSSSSSSSPSLSAGRTQGLAKSEEKKSSEALSVELHSVDSDTELQKWGTSKVSEALSLDSPSQTKLHKGVASSLNIEPASSELCSEEIRAAVSDTERQKEGGGGPPASDARLVLLETECQKVDGSQEVVDEAASGRLSQSVSDQIEDRLGEAGCSTQPAPEKEVDIVSTPGDQACSGTEAEVSQDADRDSPQHTETVSESRTSPLLSSETDEATLVGDSEPSEGWQEADVMELSAESGREVCAFDKVTDQESEEKSEEMHVLTGPEQAEVCSPEHSETVMDSLRGESEDPSIMSQASYSAYETLETIPTEVAAPVNDGEAEEEPVALEAEQSADSGLSRDNSFAHISFSENAQSVTSVSSESEPTLLSMSTEGEGGGRKAGEEEGSMGEVGGSMGEVGVFQPPSTSSLKEEEEGKGEGSALTQALPTTEELSPVNSPPLNFTTSMSGNDSAATFSSNESTTLSSNESSETSRLDSSVDTLVDRCGEATGGGGREEEETARGGGEWLEQRDSFGSLEGSSSSPSSSFVKCMIEEAMGMEDPSKHEDSSSDNHSEEKSESSKVDSEFEKSVYSGHESSDDVDIETTTSSDIEIISTPTPNGEKNIVDLSPIRFSLQKAASSRSHGPSHQRTDSSSSSTNSKGEVDHLSPERDSSDPHLHPHAHHSQRGPPLDWHREEEDLDDPHHPQRLLKKLAEMAEVLQARERQVVHLSKDNNDLLETNSILRSQLQQAEEMKEAEMTDLKALTEEFTRRMGESERKIQAVLKEKEAVKEQLQVAEKELASRSADVNLEAVLAEKDEQITGLLEEGEKLSKQQLQNSNIIKKLRVKEKENEKQLTSQKKKLDQQQEELDRLKTVLDSKEDMEKKQADAIKQLNSAVQLIEKEKAKLKVDLEASEEKIRGLQSTLDSSYKELAELHKTSASQDSRAQQAALSAEMQVREELKMAMEQQSQQHRHEREVLLMQIEDLRLSLARMEKEHNRREEMLKQEITDLQMRLQEDESRTQELTQSVSSATRPLLRQIENLQATHSMQASAWEKVEKNLTDRLLEAQTVLAMAQEKERTSTDRLTEVTSRCAALEHSNSTLRQEKAQLTAQLDSDRRRLEMLEERKANDVAQLEMTKQKLSDEVAALRRDKVFLESQLETERSRVSSEKQRVEVAEEQIRILERERPKSRGTPSPVSVSRQESMNSSLSERSSTPTWLPRHLQEEGEGGSVKFSLYDSVRQSGAASFLENLQAQLKMREGEISQLQADIQQLERTRESMARELVNLTTLNEELQEQVQELPKMTNQFQELDGRYNALLQMYGEKEERVQELMLDLEDVKEMYKQQINSLMK